MWTVVLELLLAVIIEVKWLRFASLRRPVPLRARSPRAANDNMHWRRGRPW